MRILFVTKPHLPTVGGAQLTTHCLALALVQKGHAVMVLSQERRSNSWAVPAGSVAEYPTWISPRPHADLARLLRVFHPDVAVVGSYGASSREWSRTVLRASASIPTVLYLHDVANLGLCRDEASRIDLVLGVSDFVTARAAAVGVKAFTVRPIVDRDRYRVTTSRRVALFVSPVPPKGLSTALALAAARPDIPFLFQHCWHVPQDILRLLRHRTAKLPNVVVRSPVHSQEDLYADTRLVLAPSTYPEAFGRVAAEAQASSIPVLATNVGGLAEATRDGGILVPRAADITPWVGALGRLWDDQPTYASYTCRADRRFDSRELSAPEVVKRFEKSVRPLLGTGKAPRQLAAARQRGR